MAPPIRIGREELLPLQEHEADCVHEIFIKNIQDVSRDEEYDQLEQELLIRLDHFRKQLGEIGHFRVIRSRANRDSTTAFLSFKDISRNRVAIEMLNAASISVSGNNNKTLVFEPYEYCVVSHMQSRDMEDYQYQVDLERENTELLRQVDEQKEENASCGSC